MHRPCGLHLGGTDQGLCYVGELPPQLAVNESFPNLGPRISIYNLKGERLARLGDIRPGEAPNQFWAPHGIATDAEGSLFVGEVSWSTAGKNLDPPRELTSFRKLLKAG
jgi:hypothetical protein